MSMRRENKINGVNVAVGSGEHPEDSLRRKRRQLSRVDEETTRWNELVIYCKKVVFDVATTLIELICH